jgi:polysaccharide deacetylase 2 family uncharacterized protein YibQ
MTRRRRTPFWHLALSGSLVAISIILVPYLHWRDLPPAQPPVPAAKIEARRAFDPPAPVAEPKARNRESLVALGDNIYQHVDAALQELGILPEFISKRRGTKQVAAHRVDLIRVRVPVDLPLAAVNLHLTRFLRHYQGRVLSATEFQEAQKVEMRCGFDTVETTRFILERDARIERETGQIAIVLDDFGYASKSEWLFERFCALPYPLTLAILPNEGRVRSLIERARTGGHEVLVHLPMEPDDYPDKDPGVNAVLVDQEEKTIRLLVRNAIRRVPGAIGVNNHMGSRATADARVMEQVLKEIHRQGMFFLDSRTSSASVAYTVAQRMDVPALSRDLFIDPVDDAASVEKRLWELATLAARNGRAVGIGHDREQTLLALEAVLPRLEARGFQLVPVSELIR